MEMERKRGQISTEILVLLGLMLALLIPLLIYSYSRAGVAREDLSVQKADFAINRLSALTNSVGYLGGAAAIIEEIEAPQHIKKVYVKSHDIVMEVYSSGGVKQMVASTDFELESSGLDRITAGGTYFIEAAATTDFYSGKQTVKLTLK